MLYEVITRLGDAGEGRCRQLLAELPEEVPEHPGVAEGAVAMVAAQPVAGDDRVEPVAAFAGEKAVV